MLQLASKEIAQVQSLAGAALTGQSAGAAELIERIAAMLKAPKTGCHHSVWTPREVEEALKNVGNELGFVVRSSCKTTSGLAGADFVENFRIAAIFGRGRLLFFKPLISITLQTGHRIASGGEPAGLFDAEKSGSPGFRITENGDEHNASLHSNLWNAFDRLAAILGAGLCAG